MMRPDEIMDAETVTVDMATRTVEVDGEVLPVVWWGDADNDPCPFVSARNVSAGPDRDGLYVQIALDETQGRLQ
jgi:hypothetical protein